MNPINSVIVTPLDAEQFAAAFRHDNFKGKQFYVLRLIAPRSGPGTNTFLVTRVEDPVHPELFRWAVWNAGQLPGSIQQSAHRYFIEDVGQFWIANVSFDKLLASLGNEEFYDVMEFPSTTEFYEQMTSQIWRP